MIDVALPRLMNAAGTALERELHPISESLSLNITPLSTATIELPKDENLPARRYVELFTPMGSAGFFRVRSPEDAYGEDTTTAELEHAISEVGDYLVKAKIDQMMAANTAMTTLFSHYRGSKWQIGSTAGLGSGQVAVQANYDRLLDSMLSVMNQVDGCMMTFNFSTSPWTINFVQKDATVSAEGRLSRNVNAARVIYDDTELCTRAYYEKASTTDIMTDGYPTFKVTGTYSAGMYVIYSSKLYRLPNGHRSGVTWANTTKVAITDIPTTVWAHKDANTLSTYGTIERMVNTSSDFTDSEAETAVNEYLRQHKKPRITISITAEELSQVTGETLDTFVIGKKFRLALPDYNTVFEDNITGLDWDDVYGNPQEVTVRLGDEEDTAVNFLHDVDTSGGSGGGGGGGKKQEDKWKEYRTRFEQDDYHFSLVAERVSRAEEVLQQAGLYIDSNGVLLYAQDNENNFGSKLKVESDRISLVVEGTGPNAHIKPASIVTAINQQTGQSVVKLSADVIDIDGIVEDLEAYAVTVGSFTSEGQANFDDYAYFDSGLEADTVTTDNFNFDGDGVEWKSQQVVRSVSLSESKKDFRLADNTTWESYVVTDVTANTTTIYYLGKSS